MFSVVSIDITLKIVQHCAVVQASVPQPPVLPLKSFQHCAVVRASVPGPWCPRQSAGSAGGTEHAGAAA